MMHHYTIITLYHCSNISLCHHYIPRTGWFLCLGPLSPLSPLSSHRSPSSSPASADNLFFDSSTQDAMCSWSFMAGGDSRISNCQGSSWGSLRVGVYVYIILIFIYFYTFWYLHIYIYTQLLRFKRCALRVKDYPTNCCGQATLRDPGFEWFQDRCQIQKLSKNDETWHESLVA
jgi:hypothetical protein